MGVKVTSFNGDNGGEMGEESPLVQWKMEKIIYNLIFLLSQIF